MQFEQLSLPDSHFSVHQPDHCIIARDKVGLIRNILTQSEDDVDRAGVSLEFHVAGITTVVGGTL